MTQIRSMGSLPGTGALGILSMVAICGCGLERERAEPDEPSEVEQAALSPNPCTAVTMTLPMQNFTATVGVPVSLTGSATCPVGQTPEYQYWAKLSSAANWTILGSYVPGSSTWTPPSGERWCVTVVARAIGAPENYQVRAASRCTAPRCGDSTVETGEQCDDGNTINGDACDNNCTLPACGNGILDPGEQCDDGNAANGDGCDTTCTISAPVLAYVKASNTGAGDFFYSVTLSADGSTLAVGAIAEDSAATGIGGNQADNSARDAGAVYVFTRSGTTWSQQAYVKASNTGARDAFGYSVALSGDGSILAVGAREEDSAATGINGNQADNSATIAGAVYVFTRSGTTWSQQAYVKASNTNAFDGFGNSLALSADGSTLAVGASGETSAATGINGNQADNSTPHAGAVYMFTRSGTAWSQQAYVKASNTNVEGLFYSVALSADGSTLAVGARGESSAATGIGGNQADNSASFAGAVYVFTRSGTTWNQQAYVKASNTDLGDQFGASVALSADGSTLVAGAVGESSAATGIGGNQADNSVTRAGAAYEFTRSGTTWSQQAYIKASNPGAADNFGSFIALSADGLTLAVDAPSEDSAATGINGNGANNSAADAGAVYVFP